MPRGVVSGEDIAGCFPRADCFIIYSCCVSACASKSLAHAAWTFEQANSFDGAQIDSKNMNILVAVFSRCGISIKVIRMVRKRLI